MSRRLYPAAIRNADPATLARVARLLAAEPATLQVATPHSAFAVVRHLLVGFEVERFVVAALDRRNRVIDVPEVLTIGSDAFTVVCPRQVFRFALTRSKPAAAILIAHNHPSGDHTPSTQDNEVTRRIKAAGKVLDMPLVDHIIVADGESGEGEFYSYAGDPRSGFH